VLLLLSAGCSDRVVVGRELEPIGAELGDTRDGGKPPTDGGITAPDLPPVDEADDEAENDNDDDSDGDDQRDDAGDDEDDDENDD
jgi:hypothetical protein